MNDYELNQAKKQIEKLGLHPTPQEPIETSYQRNVRRNRERQRRINKIRVERNIARYYKFPDDPNLRHQVYRVEFRRNHIDYKSQEFLTLEEALKRREEMEMVFPPSNNHEQK